MSTYSTDDSFGSPTPKIVKWLMAFHLGMGLLSGFFNSVLGRKLHISFLKLFAFSWPGLAKGWLWQPLTYIFIPEIEGTLNFYFLFTLCFDTYLLWLMGCRVQEEVGDKVFLKIFFLPAILSSLAILGITHLLGIQSVPLFGISYGILPLVVAYCFLNPKAQFSFFLPYPVRLRWVGLALTLLYLLQDLSNLNFIALFSHLSLLLFAHLYLVLFLRKKSPFSFTHPFDEFLISLRTQEHNEKITPLYTSTDTLKGLKRLWKRLKNQDELPGWKRLVLWVKTKLSDSGKEL